PELRGVIFDMDGTLIHPQKWMFTRMRELLKITKKVDILTHISSLPPGVREENERLIQSVEEEAMKEMKPSAGMWELLEFLLGEEGPIPLGIVTRNFEKPLSYYLTEVITAKLPHNAHTPIFDPVVDRSFTPPKPDGAPLVHVLKQWGLEEEREGVLMVGDSRDDMLAARRAGVWAVLVSDDEDVVKELREEGLVDVFIPTLGELVGMIKGGLTAEE
ncbi:HAD-like protein, partial [Ascobolus immersus RN42]